MIIERHTGIMDQTGDEAAKRSTACQTLEDSVNALLKEPSESAQMAYIQALSAFLQVGSLTCYRQRVYLVCKSSILGHAPDVATS